MLSADSVFEGSIDPLGTQRYFAQGVAAIGSSAASTSVTRSGLSRLTSPGTLPLFILFLTLVGAMLTRALLTGAGRAGTLAFHVLTCGLCQRKAGVDDEDLGYIPTFAQAISLPPGHPLALQGVASYSMLQNPLVIELFAITPEFAALHRSLSSVARFKIELRKGSTGSGAAAGSMIFGSASMRLGTERAGSMMAGDGGRTGP